MQNLMEKIVSLCKRRGFIFPSSEIYGGFGSCYDFGPLGVEMKNNIKLAWWQEMTRAQENIVGLDAAILMSPKVWQASGHLTAGFSDELVECKKCQKRFRTDQIDEKCPECGGELTAPRKFNLMMKTFVGPVEDEASQAYLRAETCQGIYMNFENVLNSMRLKIPFGIAQIGKAFRNEINPKDFLYRMREFEQMEMQWFCQPKDADKFFDYWQKERINWYLSLGIKKENLRAREVPKKELAHYARKAVDIEYNFPFGWKEIEGVHNRGDWDLSNHSKHSGQDLKYEGYYPYIIETSVGVDRSFLTFLVDAYQEVAGGRTKNFGKLRVLGKAARKIASKLRPAVEIFCLSEIEFIQGKTQKTLTDAILIDKFSGIKKEFKKIRIAGKIAETLDNLIKGPEPDEKIWQLLTKTFETLNTELPLAGAKVKMRQCLIAYHYFFWNLAAILGYQPELYHCVRCHKKVVQEKNYFFPKEGGIVCGGCARGLDNEISSETIKILRIILKKDWPTLLKLKFEAQYLKELICRDYLSS